MAYRSSFRSVGSGCRYLKTRSSAATERIQGNQAFAWNPSIAGTKSEDTILLSDKGTEIVSQVGDWPCTEVDGIRRPDILQWE